MIQGDQGHSSFGSNNSSASAGTGTQLQGRRLAYTPALSQWSVALSLCGCCFFQASADRVEPGHIDMTTQ